MKTLLSIGLLGMTIMYFMGIAFHIDYFTEEMLIHNGLRFAIGFFLLGVWIWYKHKPTFKIGAYIILVICLSDSVLDYFRGIDNLRFEMIIHDAFMLFWSALLGFFFARHFKQRKS